MPSKKKRGRPRKDSVKTKTPRRKKSKKTGSPLSTDPETSPCKGFNEVPLPKTANKCDFTKKEDLFDSLLDENHKRNFKYNPNMKTYANKKKETPQVNLLKFHDNETRNDVVKWLNDNRNVFDRLTQSQFEAPEDFDTQLTLDMPSVSQAKSNRPTRELRRHCGPYNLRAKSLDIKVQKNEQKGRNERHSLAGDTPEMENYIIEEVVTRVEAPVPADVKAIQDLMEDEYLDHLEKEMLQGEDRRNYSGWDRIRDLNKSINTKRRPKQLKITVKESQSKHETCSNLCFDYSLFENYFVETTEKLLGAPSKLPTREKDNVLNVGKRFLSLLTQMVAKNGGDSLKELRSLVMEANQLLQVLESKATQTVVENAAKGVQTASSSTHVGVQTYAPVRNESAQTETHTVSIGVQTENLVLKLSRQASSASSATVSDIFPFVRRERVEPNDAFKDDLDFDTEDLLRIDSDIKNQPEDVEGANKGDLRSEMIAGNSSVESQRKDSGGTKRESTTATTAKSVLVVSNEKSDSNKGNKRPLGTPEFDRPKRPCAKFINEHLSVGFSSCVGEELEEPELKEKVTEWPEGSDDDECLVNLLTKYEKERNNPNLQAKSTTQERMEELEKMITDATELKFCTDQDLNKREAKKSNVGKTDSTAVGASKITTQEHMEGLENLIYNATKGKPLAEEENPVIERSSTTIIDVDDDMDYFQSSFDLRTNKTARRSLFASTKEEEENRFSESMFGSLTQDIVMQKCNEEEEDTKKINILEDIILKPADVAMEDDETNSDVDIVECTPQKADLSFKKQRKELVLDVTLPPPLEFQDSEKANYLNQSTVEQNLLNSPRYPLAAINKITSTPSSQTRDSENCSVSPISCYGNNWTPKHSSGSVYEKTNQENQRTKSTRKNKRVLGPFELAQQQARKFSPLTIIKKPVSEETHFNSTPKQKSILTYIRASQESENIARKPCIACSRLSKEQVIAISSLTNKKLVTYSTSFTQRVTHLVVSVNEKNCLKDHTIKFVSAVAAGAWVLNFGWIQECLAKNALVSEQPYEVLDVSGQPGPQKSRLMGKTQPLLKGYRIYVAPPFASTTREEIENVVKLSGGTTVRTPEHLLDKNGNTCIIVTEAKATQDFDLYETWLEVLKVVTVDIEWLSRSVGQYRLLSLRPFTLCSDDTIETLGYPANLTENMIYSFSQQTFSSVPSS